MAWIELHQALPTHRKTLALADALDLPPIYAMAHVTAFWLWALDNAPDGRLGDTSNRTIARVAQWSGDAHEFVNALLTAGFLDRTDDGHLRIHDWYDYAGRLIDRRKASVERTRRWREQNEHVTHSERITNAATVPNRTVPNHTVPTTNTNTLIQGPATPDTSEDSPSSTAPEMRVVDDDWLDAAPIDEPEPPPTLSKKQRERQEMTAKVKAVWGDWRSFRPQYRTCPEKEIRACLKEFTVEECIAARQNAIRDPFWLGVLTKNGPTSLYKPERIDQFRNYEYQPEEVSNGQSRQSPGQPAAPDPARQAILDQFARHDITPGGCGAPGDGPGRNGAG